MSARKEIPLQFPPDWWTEGSCLPQETRNDAFRQLLSVSDKTWLLWPAWMIYNSNEFTNIEIMITFAVEWFEIFCVLPILKTEFS